MAKQWTFKPPFADAAPLAKALGLPMIVGQVLGQRGYTTPESARSFLKPELTELHEPSAMPGLVEAAERLVSAARAAEPIVIYGDYDADGITAAAILWQALRLADANVRVYIPHRLEEGYGLNLEAIEKIAAEGAKVLVTVDCGISGVEETARARVLGLDVIITDHHEPTPGHLPDANVLVNPKLPGSPYPFRELSGAGIALKLAWAIGQRLSQAQRVSDPFREFLVAATGLAALGTIADVVPLVGENHVVASFGLRALAGSRHPGITALIEVAGLANKPIDSEGIGFMVAPRLNAAGRLGHAREAVELLTSARPRRPWPSPANWTARTARARNSKRRFSKRPRPRSRRPSTPTATPPSSWSARVAHRRHRYRRLAYRRAALPARHSHRHERGAGPGVGPEHPRVPPLQRPDGVPRTPADLRRARHGRGPAAARGQRGGVSRGVPGPRRQCPGAGATHAAPQHRRRGEPRRPEHRVGAITGTDGAFRGRQRAGHAGDSRGPPGGAAPAHGTPGGTPQPSTHPGRPRRRAIGWRMGPVADTLGRAKSCGVAFTARLSNYSGHPEVELHIRDLWVGRYGDQAAAKEFA